MHCLRMLYQQLRNANEFLAYPGIHIESLQNNKSTFRANKRTRMQAESHVEHVKHFIKNT